MRAQKNSNNVDISHVLNLHHDIDCARKLQDEAVNAFISGELSEDKAIEAVNYVEKLEACFVKAGGCYKDLYH